MQTITVAKSKRNNLTKRASNLQAQLNAKKRNFNEKRTRRGDLLQRKLTRNNIGRFINQNLRYKNNDKKLEYLGSYVPKSTLTSRKQNRIVKGRNAMVQAEANRFNKRWANETINRETLNQMISSLTSNLKSLKQNLSSLNAEDKRTARDLFDAYKSAFESLGFTYVPKGKEWIQPPPQNYYTPQGYFKTIPQHFIYETMKYAEKNTPVPEGWTKEERKEERNVYENSGGISQMYSQYTNSGPKKQMITTYLLRRPLPPGYPEGSIFEKDWDTTLQKLMAL